MPKKLLVRTKRARAPSPTPDLDNSHRDSLMSSAGPGTPLDEEFPGTNGSGKANPEVSYPGSATEEEGLTEDASWERHRMVESFIRASRRS